MKEILKKTMREFVRCGVLINYKYELVLNTKTNIWFKLDDVETELDFKCKLLEFVSRDCFKAEPYSTDKRNVIYQHDNLASINNILDTNFSTDDMELIYSELGNGCNRKLCIEFINSGYDLKLLAGG